MRKNKKKADKEKEEKTQAGCESNGFSSENQMPPPQRRKVVERNRLFERRQSNRKGTDKN